MKCKLCKKELLDVENTLCRECRVFLGWKYRDNPGDLLFYEDEYLEVEQ